MSFYALRDLWLRSFVAGGVAMAIILGGVNFAHTAQAQSFQIFARVGLSQEDFFLKLGGIESGQVVDPLTITTFSLNYASLYTSPTEMIVLTVTWDTEGEDEVLRYIEDSATTGIGPSAPVVDLQHKTITWQISPMPGLTHHEVYWQLGTVRGSPAISSAEFTVTAKLIGPGFEKLASPLSGRYRYVPVIVTPTPPPKPTPAPTVSPPVTPSLTPTATPTEPPIPSVSPSISPPPSGGTVTPPPHTPRVPPSILRPLFPIIGSIPFIGSFMQTSLEALEQIAQGGGGIAAVPVPVLLTLIPAVTTIIPLASSVPWWQLPSLLAALFWMRRKHQWGVVYDAATKEPIDPAIVTLTDEDNRKYMAITDYFGRYQFLVDPGTYQLKADKSNYVFPAQSLKNATSDGVYDNLYYGGDLTYNKDAAVVVNIPMESMRPDWNQRNKTALKNPFWRSILYNPWLFRLGFIWSLLMVMLAASAVNVLVLCFYLFLLALRQAHSIRHPWGVLYDRHNHPVAGAKIELIDTNNPTVKRPPIITKPDGRYSFLVPKGSYELSIQTRNESEGFAPAIAGPKVVVHSQFGAIAHDLKLE